jgi:hypothetical protein
VKNNINVPKSSKQKNIEKIQNKIFCLHFEGHWRKEQDLDPEPLVSGTGPRIRICTTKMSRIRNTGGTVPFGT